jgi:hypothetical protein
LAGEKMIVVGGRRFVVDVFGGGRMIVVGGRRVVVDVVGGGRRWCNCCC